MDAVEAGQEQLTDPARLAAVRRYEVLDSPREAAIERVARMAAVLFAVPISTVSIVDAGRIWLAAAEGLDGVTELGVEPGLCPTAMLADSPYVVLDALTDPRTRQHPLVCGAPGLRFYAAAPIISADGYRLGTVTTIDLRPRTAEQVTHQQLAMLTELAGMVTDLLEMNLATLIAARAERQALSGAPLWTLEEEQARLRGIV